MNPFKVQSFVVDCVPRVLASLEPFYEAGSCQEEFGGLIGSPFYSSFHDSLRFLVVVSFNGATSLILGCEFCSQGSTEFLVISISFRTHLVPLEPDRNFMSGRF